MPRGSAAEIKGICIQLRDISSNMFLFFVMRRLACLGSVRGCCRRSFNFGQNGMGCIRFSYANSLENIAEVLERIERYLERR